MFIGKNLRGGGSPFEREFKIRLVKQKYYNGVKIHYGFVI